MDEMNIINFLKEKEKRDSEMTKRVSELVENYRKNIFPEFKEKISDYTPEEIEVAIIANAFTSGYLNALADYNIG